MKSELFLFAWGAVRTDDDVIHFWIFCFDDLYPSAGSVGSQPAIAA
jgi:hypothetical protein